MVSKTVEDANRELVKQGYKPTVTAQDVAQVSDNPQSAAQAENLLDGKPTTISDSSTKSDTVEQTSTAPKPAAMADWDESKHKRADDVKFGEGGGGGGGDKHRDAEHASPSNNEMPKENKKAQARRADIISKSKPAKEQEYYHGTAASNVESILKDGIQPTDNTMGFHAAFAGGEGLAFSYGAGSAAAHNDDHVAMVILKGGKDSGLLNPPGADNIAYKPGAIHPSQIDRIEIFHKDAGKNDKPVKVIRPEKKIA
jgi:hypothetical protein